MLKFVDLVVKNMHSRTDNDFYHNLCFSFRDNELFLPSFHAQYGYKNKFCASDVVFACEALLESVVGLLFHLPFNVQKKYTLHYHFSSKALDMMKRQ